MIPFGFKAFIFFGVKIPRISLMYLPKLCVHEHADYILRYEAVREMTPL